MHVDGVAEPAVKRVNVELPPCPEVLVFATLAETVPQIVVTVRVFAVPVVQFVRTRAQSGRSTRFMN